MRYGDEFVNVLDEIRRASVDRSSTPVSVLRRLLDRPESKCLYVGGGRVELSADQELSEITLATGRAIRMLVVPENKTLWFGPGGQLVLAAGILLVIRGQIRAEATTIFSLPEVRRRDDVEGSSIVRLENPWLEEVLVEWFGAQSRVSEAQIRYTEETAWMNQRAFQACIHAMCRDRSRSSATSSPGDPSEPLTVGPRLPPVTIVLRGIYDVIGTLHATALPGDHPSLWIRGENNATWGSHGIPAIFRYSANSVPTQFPGVSEGNDSAALRVSPSVSVMLSRVGIYTNNGGEDAPRSEDVARTLDVRETDASPRWRHLFADRCSFRGGRDAAVSIQGEPSVAKGVVPARASRATRYTLYDSTVDAKFAQFRCARVLVDLSLTQDAMVCVDGGLLYTGGPLPARAPAAGDLARAYACEVDAGIHLRGASLFVRGASFHIAEGPRPSRFAPAPGAPARPDGQDIWWEVADRDAGVHVTALHLDSQSWWFLGSSAPASRQAVGAISVLNVGAGNVNWDNYLDVRAVAGLRVGGMPGNLDANQETVFWDPPSVAWGGGALPLLLEACHFDRYVTTPILSPGDVPITDIATTMGTPPVAAATTWWVVPEAIPRGVYPRRVITEVETLPRPPLQRLSPKWWSR